jgi:hypothetical protein
VSVQLESVRLELSHGVGILQRLQLSGLLLGLLSLLLGVGTLQGEVLLLLQSSELLLEILVQGERVSDRPRSASKLGEVIRRVLV